MEKNPLPHQKIIFVCTNKREEGERVCCCSAGGNALRDTLKAMVKERGLKNAIRVSQSGCMDRCEKGANVMVFPDNIWYSAVRLEDLNAILDAAVEGLTPKP